MGINRAFDYIIFTICLICLIFLLSFFLLNIIVTRTVGGGHVISIQINLFYLVEVAESHIFFDYAIITELLVFFKLEFYAKLRLATLLFEKSNVSIYINFIFRYVVTKLKTTFV